MYIHIVDTSLVYIISNYQHEFLRLHLFTLTGFKNLYRFPRESISHRRAKGKQYHSFTLPNTGLGFPFTCLRKWNITFVAFLLRQKCKKDSQFETLDNPWIRGNGRVKSSKKRIQTHLSFLLFYFLGSAFSLKTTFSEEKNSKKVWRCPVHNYVHATYTAIVCMYVLHLGCAVVSPMYLSDAPNSNTIHIYDIWHTHTTINYNCLKIIYTYSSIFPILPNQNGNLYQINHFP